MYSVGNMTEIILLEVCLVGRDPAHLQQLSSILFLRSLQVYILYLRTIYIAICRAKMKGFPAWPGKVSVIQYLLSNSLSSIPF